MVQVKVIPLLYSARGYSVSGIKPCERSATSAELGVSQAMLSCESRLAAASARPGAH